MTSKVVNIEDFKEPKSFWRHTVFLSLVCVLAFTVGALSYYWFGYLRFNVTTDDAYVESDISPVNSRIMGFVKEVLVSDHQMVKRGQVLAIFDNTDIKVELEYKQAKLSKARSDMKRAQTLAQSRAISSSDLEIASTNKIAMQADYDGSLLKLKYTEIISPIDGIIAKKNILPGQFIQPGQSLFAIVPVETSWIKSNYKETQLEFVKAQMRVKISADAFPNAKIYGHVETIAPTSGAKLSLLPPENASGNFTKVVQRIPVRIKIDLVPEGVHLRPGMSVSTTILTHERI